ncbi:class I SAM-dependent methyltransferase [Candidatus Woesearchaeota archaeon]|nr:class I SAM-dependent methyltransferase [Candidatus Woesearchaeota archaeon]
MKLIIRNIKGKAVLDIGSAGQGNVNSDTWIFGTLQKYASSLKGIDIEPCNDPNVTVGSAETFSFREKFDVITLFDVIEHVDNVGIALENMKKHLNDGGKVIMTTPNMTSIGPFLDVLLLRGIKSNKTHTLGYNAKMLHYMLRKHGFKDIKIKFDKYPLAGNHTGVKKLFSVLRCVCTYPITSIWKEFSPTLYVSAKV